MIGIDNQVMQLGAILVQRQPDEEEASRIKTFLEELSLDGPVAKIPGHFIVCDADGCGYREDLANIYDYVDLINAPCPKCGENILTGEDMAVMLAHLADYHKMNTVALALGEEKFNQLLGIAASMTGVELEESDRADFEDPEYVRHTIRSDGQGGISVTPVPGPSDA